MLRLIHADRLPLIIVGIILALICSFSVAFAQSVSVPMPSGGIDFTPLVDTLLNGLLAALTGVVGIAVAFVARKANQWFGVQMDDSARALIDTSLRNGIGWAAERVRSQYKGKLTLETRNQLVELAAAYAISRTPDALNRFGLNPNTKEGWDSIQNLVESRMGGLVFDDDPRPAKVAK